MQLGNLITIIITAALLYGCSDNKIQRKEPPLFNLVVDSISNLSFENIIQDSDTLNYDNFPYIYMGGGVAISDFNNDGLSDIYVTGNMVENKLYLNKGNLVFEDISVKAGVQGDNRWYTGISIVDINHDGYMDIYLSVSGKDVSTKNQLFINKGDLTFKEEAATYRIDDVANYPLVPLTQGNLFYLSLMKKNNPEQSGHLYRNDNGLFTDVTATAGVQNFGLTLGLSSADLNNDGWPDLYLSNDFNVPDYFYINKGDGTFRETLKESLGHTSMFGMGIDVADFNNDGLLDLVQADMTPEDYRRSKINMASMSPKSFWEAVNFGFHFQYMQNSLQLNNGSNLEGIPVFSEISRMAGIATTDWSWSTLFMDLDNDGWKDIYITNGMKRDVNDNDINNKSNATTFQQANRRISIEQYPSEPLDNYAYKNLGDYTFTKSTKKWGLDYKGFSNGMAYGDLDNDGDLDLVINNLDQKISLYENRTANNGSQFLRFKLKGSEKNPNGYGAKMVLKNKITTNVQAFEMLTTRGFQSSMEPIAHFGLGNDLGDYELNIFWPDGKEEVIEVNKINQTLILDYSQATENKKKSSHTISSRFNNITQQARINFIHEEDSYDDFIVEPLLPHKYSTQGPGLAVADINGDGLDDFFVGNASGKSSALYLQLTNKTFSEMEGPWQDDFNHEDTGALFFDGDNDGDIDLYVVSGGHDPSKNQFYYQDKLYLNTSRGFVKATNSLPTMNTAGKVITAADYDNDGDLDLFVGGRNIPGSYPAAPDSYLLKNNGKSDQSLKFEDVTSQECPSFNQMGLITSAEWTDLNGDGWIDLIVAGEWMPIKVFMNNKGRLEEKTKEMGLAHNLGWWFSLYVMDVDNDGDQDIIAGNLGLNYKYKASPEKPFELFAADFDKNGKIDIVLGQHKEGKLVPLRGRECSSQQIPAIERKFTTYREFASADIFEIYGKSEISKSNHLQATEFAHYWLENNGNGTFNWHLLPNRSQFAPINSIVPIDYNGDVYTDLLISGNLYDSEVETPRADAGIGLILQNNEGKGFIAVEPTKSNLMVSGNTQNSKPIKLGAKTGFLFVGSNEDLKLIQLKN